MAERDRISGCSEGESKGPPLAFVMVVSSVGPGEEVRGVDIGDVQSIPSKVRGGVVCLVEELDHCDLVDEECKGRYIWLMA